MMKACFTISTCFAMLVALMAFHGEPMQLQAADLTGVQQLEKSAENEQHTYFLFYRNNDQRTAAMEKTIERHVDAHADATAFRKVNVFDKNEQEIVKKYDARRMSVPCVLCVAPNGAVTCVYNRVVSAEQLKRSLLTPKYADVVLALQEGKIAVVSLVRDADSEPLAAAEQFMNSGDFKDAATHVKVRADDASEEEFFTRVKVDRNIDAAKMILFAPPGRYLGTFDATTSFETIAQKVHASGSCSCEKCQEARGR